MKKLLLFVVVLLTHQLHSQNSGSAQKEILVVYFSRFPYEAAGVYFYYGGDKHEVLAIEPRTKEERMQTPEYVFRRILIANTFSELYERGWSLILYNADDNTYFFERSITT